MKEYEATEQAYKNGYEAGVKDGTNNITKAYVWMDRLENPFNYWKIDFDKFETLCFKTLESAQSVAKAMQGEQ